jgi:hypothetical protein
MCLLLYSVTFNDRVIDGKLTSPLYTCSKVGRGGIVSSYMLQLPFSLVLRLFWPAEPVICWGLVGWLGQHGSLYLIALAY